MPLIPIQAVVKENRYVTDSVCIVTLTLIKPAEIDFKAGQYLFVKANERVLRPYSIASSPSLRNEVEFCVKRIEGGVASNYIWNLQAGQTVELTGVFGHFFYKQDSQMERIVLIGTGTGVAPLKSMFIFALESGETRPIHLFFGEREIKDFYYLDELAEYREKYPHFTYTLCASRDTGDGFFSGRVTQALGETVPLQKKTSFYLCGGQAMLTDVRAFLITNNVLPGQIYLEKFF